jgi:Family of unknown function (DUF6174)
MTSMKHALLAALLPLGLGAAAGPAAAADPQPVTPFVPGANEDPELSAAWQRWQAKDIDDYVITVRQTCFCARTQPVETVIRDDRTVRVTRGDQRLGASRGWSMDELYALVREARSDADRVDVEWTRRGVPRSIVIDPDTMAADEETYYSVTLRRP